MKNNFLIFSLPLFLVTSTSFAAREKTNFSSDETPVISDPALTPTPIPVPPTPTRVVKNQNPSKTLVIHKPKPSPSWGKVIQYHRDQILALSEKNREIIHEFVFQDDGGIIRTATFHENASGEGYWEVWVWDQP